MSSSIKAKDAIWPTSDRKVRKYKTQFNTFGLMPGLLETCPGATTGKGGCCEIKPGRKQPICYVMGLLSAYKGVRNILEHNTHLLKNADVPRQEELLVREFDRFTKAEYKRAQRLNTIPWLWYRLHWSGDFFNIDYAKAAASAMRRFPNVRFWTYTRSFLTLPYFRSVDNLILYLSLDACNIVTGLSSYYANRSYFNSGNLQICYLSPDKQNDFSVRWWQAKQACYNVHNWDSAPPLLADCPVDLKQVPLEGGCAACQKCLGLCPKKKESRPDQGECASCQRCQLVDPNCRPIWFQP